jgi:hypothetical protein
MFLTSVRHKFEIGVIDAARKDVQNDKIFEYGNSHFLFFLLFKKKLTLLLSIVYSYP